jgi:hypothetical protein
MSAWQPSMLHDQFSAELKQSWLDYVLSVGYPTIKQWQIADEAYDGSFVSSSELLFKNRLIVVPTT